MKRAIKELRLRKKVTIRRKRKSKKKEVVGGSKTTQKAVKERKTTITNLKQQINTEKQEETQEQQLQQEEKQAPSKRRVARAFEAFRTRNGSNKQQQTLTGTRLLSGSFQLISSTAGFVATGVRVTGDTAAGLMGTSVKGIGTVVKTVGVGLNSASKLLDKNSDKGGSTSKLDLDVDTCRATDRITEQQQQNTSKQQSILNQPEQKKKKEPNHKRPYIKRTQAVAAKTVRLLGNVFDGLGETMLIAGVAAESLASSTAGVAEETVRIIEDLAGTISIAISLRGEHRNKKKNDKNEESPLSNQQQHNKRTPVFLSFGTYPDNEGTFLSEDEKRARLLVQLQAQWMKEPTIHHSWELIELLREDIATFGRNVSADVEGVPSMTTELAAALLLCHLLAVVVLYRRPSKGEGVGESKAPLGNPGKDTPVTDACWSSKLEWVHSKVLTNCQAVQSLSMFQIICSTSRCLVNLLFALLCHTGRLLFRVGCSRELLLLLVYGLVWTYLSRRCQDKALLVQRHAEAVGFRNGLATISGTSLPTETTLWLNKVLKKVWRVDSETDLSHQYPVFVKRASKAMTNLKQGGLEPFLSSAIGTGIVRGLDLAKTLRPTDVAYVSLFSLSLGSLPPMVRSVRISEGTWHENRIEVDLEVDAFLEDLMMVLDVKLSSLSYALLPSTQIKIHNVNFRASIKAVLFLAPQHPFVSTVELSFAEQPLCDLRVTPVSKDRSLLQGIDLGAIPFLNEWIKEAIKSGLSQYVSPRYVSIEVDELLHRQNHFQEKSLPSASLKNLRRKTLHSVVNPRTSIPQGIAVASVADKLESHHSSCQPVATVDTSTTAPRRQDEQRNERAFLRPVTELSRLAQERHDLKQDNPIRPVTELSRRGLDRWLESKLKVKQGL
eukprot:Sro219_g090320.2  (891) ;mRNA; f:14041-16964